MCSPSIPSAPPPPAPPPERADFSKQQRLAEKKKTLGRTGQQGTIETNPLGINEKANIKQKNLLGE